MEPAKEIKIEKHQKLKQYKSNVPNKNMRLSSRKLKHFGSGKKEIINFSPRGSVKKEKDNVEKLTI